MRGDRVEIVIDAGDRVRTFEIVARRAGRCVETNTVRGVVEVAEVTRTGQVVRTARFMAARVVAIVEHPVADALLDGEDAGRAGGGRRADMGGRQTTLDALAAAGDGEPPAGDG